MEKLKFNYENNILTIKALGDIDHHSAKNVREVMDKLIFEKKPSLVLMDLSNVEFMDSSGLGLILGRYTTCEEIGAEFRIIKPAPSTPRKIKPRLFQRFNRNSTASKLPVHAPVPGRGIATNKNKPR